MRGAVSLLVLVAALPSPTRAQRIAEVHAEGGCPADADLRRAVEARFGPVNPGAGWRVATGPDPNGTGTRLVLTAPNGTLALERRLVSADCAALADVFAIIVDAHFVDLGVREQAPPDGAPDTPPTPRIVPPPRPPPVPAEPIPPTIGALGLVGGLDLGLAPALSPTAYGALALQIRPSRFPLHFGLGLAIAGTTTQQAMDAVGRLTIDRWQLAGRLVAGGRLLSRPFRLDVEAGPALTIARVIVVELPEASQWRPPLLGGALVVAGGLPFGRAVLLRAEVAATVTFIGETYEIPSRSPVAESPLLSLTAGAGVQLETDL